MTLESLDKDLIYCISFYLPLNSIRNLSLTCVNTKCVINLNWNEYFMYHTGVKYNKIINKDFMIEYGRYLINKPKEIINRYLIGWPRLIELDICKIFMNPILDSSACVAFNLEQFSIEFDLMRYEETGRYINSAISHEDMKKYSFNVGNQKRIIFEYKFTEEFAAEKDTIMCSLENLYERFRFHLLTKTYFMK